MSVRFSVIIPAYNEARLLPRLLDSIAIAAARLEKKEVELIVADNLSTDETRRLAESRGCRVVTVEKRRIAAARNGGAHAARGEILCFIDADSELHPNTFAEIDKAISDDKIIVGATGVFLERRSIGLLLTYFMMIPVLWVTGMDTGVVFCRREDFYEVGGYNENLYVAEDVAFLYALKRRGRPSGKRLARLSGVKALASTRKFDEQGDWHYFTMLPKVIALMLRKGHSVFLKQDEMPHLTDYWYRPRR